MSNRELLELAAKASGIQILEWIDDETPWTGFGIWEPLDEDDDAHRLALKLNIDDSAMTEEQDENEAARLDIVRAAASIGRNMP